MLNCTAIIKHSMSRYHKRLLLEIPLEGIVKIIMEIRGLIRRLVLGLGGKTNIPKLDFSGNLPNTIILEITY